MTGRPRTTRPGEPAPDSARVRHRTSGRLGRVCATSPEPWPGEVNVLFDGETRPSSVTARRLEYLDGGEVPPRQEALRP